jgi:hypothetical protein
MLMNRRLLTLFTALALCTVANLANARFIDFETLTPGLLPANGLADYGISSVTYGSGTGAQIYDYGNEPDIKAPSPTKVFLPSGGSFPAPAFMLFDTTLTFASPMEYFQFSKIAEVNAPYTYGIAGWRARAFDSGGGFVAEVEKNLAGGLDFPSPLPNQTFLLQGANRIKTVVFTVNYNWQSTAGTVGIDDFRFRVPEPASVAMLAVGTAFVVLSRRRPS